MAAPVRIRVIATNIARNLLGHWVREQKIMSLEEAMLSATGKTALMHDMDDRGFVAPGKVADILDVQSRHDRIEAA